MRDQDVHKAGKAAPPHAVPVRSATAAAKEADPTGLLTLQRTVGNAAVVQLLAGGSAGTRNKLKKRAAAVDKGAGRSGPAANFLAGAFGTGGNTPGAFGQVDGIGAAAMVGGALAVPDLVSSVFALCARFSAWQHATGEDRAEAGKKLLETCADVVATTSAVAGGLTTGAGNLGALADGAGPALGQAGGGLGIVTGLVTAIRKAVDAHRAHSRVEALKKADFPAKDFKRLLAHFKQLEALLGKNHEAALLTLHAQIIREHEPLRELPPAARKVQEAALRTRFEDRMDACNARYELAKTTVKDTIEQVGEAANLQAAKELGIRKGGRKTVRSMLAALGGTLGVPAGALSIVAVAFGLTAGAIPIAGWAITGVIGLITAGVLTWQLVNKVRANLKHLSADPAYRDHSGWDIFFEAVKVWKPKVGSSRDKAAADLFAGLSSQHPENKAAAEALVKALGLDPAQLLARTDPQEAVAAVKDRLAST